MDINLNYVAEIVTLLQKQTAEIHLHPQNYYISPRAIQKDRGKDFTTNVDKFVEIQQKRLLEDNFPAIGFLGEESEDNGGEGRYVWIVDPIDGTAVYSTGGDYYSNSIALADRQEKRVIFGSVYQPPTGRQFLRLGDKVLLVENIIDEQGARKEIKRKPIPSQSRGLPELMGCTFGTSKHYNKIPGINQRLEKLFDKVEFADLKRSYGMINARPASGSSALFCCDIADGNRHFALLYFQKAWDLAVGALYARDAGCIVECGTSIESHAGGNLEKTIASCTKDTLVNVGIFANQQIKDIVMQRFNNSK